MGALLPGWTWPRSALVWSLYFGSASAPGAIWKILALLTPKLLSAGADAAAVAGADAKQPEMIKEKKADEAAAPKAAEKKK